MLHSTCEKIVKNKCAFAAQLVQGKGKCKGGKRCYYYFELGFRNLLKFVVYFSIKNALEKDAVVREVVIQLNGELLSIRTSKAPLCRLARRRQRFLGRRSEAFLSLEKKNMALRLMSSVVVPASRLLDAESPPLVLQKYIINNRER